MVGVPTPIPEFAKEFPPFLNPRTRPTAAAAATPPTIPQTAAFDMRFREDPERPEAWFPAIEGGIAPVFAEFACVMVAVANRPSLDASIEI
jgi:hypothetical protein